MAAEELALTEPGVHAAPRRAALVVAFRFTWPRLGSLVPGPWSLVPGLWLLITRLLVVTSNGSLITDQ